eukprot:TRINITY_DN14428_c0_g1_i1.p1 TRINITY_DN14428_c0_g1~~TRINITY_DN14428_c0_g1_i1.p1  ORF type:complete len:300 (+),score=29.64 TRINITY_DN14428_c0_g1_i1:128-1027(+)
MAINPSITSIIDMIQANQVWFIRHACSMINLWADWRSRKINESLIPASELAFIKSTRKAFDLKFLDAPLCQRGRLQAQKSQQLVANLPIKYIISSPLARSLETTKIAFDKHMHKNKMEVIVHPLIRECLSNSDDIPKWTLTTQRDKYDDDKGLHFNFRMLEPMHSGLYFLETVQPELKEQVKKELRVVGEEKYPEVLIKLMEAKAKLTKNKRIYVESFANTRQRAKLFLVWLNEFMKRESLTPNEVAVVTHMYFLQCLAAKKFDEDGAPVYPTVPNAVPFQIDVEELLRLSPPDIRCVN